jgi:dihydroxyacetone kinase-like predicted kinase
MMEAMSRVTAGYVSPSIRDADLNGVHITSGDTIGIIEKEIVVSDPDRATATHALIAKLLEDPDKFMLTVFCGVDATEDERAALESYLAEAHPDIEVYFVDGGQEIYPYIIIAE